MRTTTLVIAGLIFSATPVLAQNCDNPAAGGTCLQMLQGSEILQARTAIALSGGNAVPGASSTLGMRIGSIPRISLAARFTGTGLDMPAVSFGSASNYTAFIHSIDVDAAVGIYSGITLAPTIGGFGSFDVVGSAGTVSIPSGNGISGKGGSWALGVRLGILRESFTAPGISVTAMYRHLGDLSAQSGNAPSGGSRGFTMKNNSDLSVRGVIGKRLFVVGANLGIGYDSYRSDVTAAAVESGPVPVASSFREDGRKNGHVTVFANATWTMLILNFVAEAGYQRDPYKNGYYGSLAARLAL